MDLLSLHNGYSPGISLDKGWDVRTTYEAMLASPALIQQSLDDVSAKIDKLAPERAGKILIAVTEWGPLFQAGTTGRFLDHGKTLGSALFVADTMMVLARQPKVEIANFFQLVDSLYMGWIGPRDGTYVPKAPYYAFQMFTQHAGTTVVRSSSTSPTYSSRAVGSVDAVPATPYLDVMATRSADGKTLYLMAVNKDFDRPIRAHIALHDFHPQSSGTAWTLNGTGIDANTGTQLFKAPGVQWPTQAEMKINPRFEHGGPWEVSITPTTVKGVATQFEYTFPAHSFTSLEVKARDQGEGVKSE
jgi:alpha-N-arabinofuranosidase